MWAKWFQIKQTGTKWNLHVINLLVILTSKYIIHHYWIISRQARVQAKRSHQMFTVWSTDPADHWAGRHCRQFQMRDGEQTKSLILPSVVSQRREKNREKMGHTQKHWHHCCLCVILRNILQLLQHWAFAAERSLSNYFVNTVIYWEAHIFFSHLEITWTFKTLISI